MEDMNVSNRDFTTSSQISYVLLDQDKKPKKLKNVSKHIPILVSLLLLVILVPLYLLTRDQYKEIIFPSTINDVPKHWIDRAIYYNSHATDNKSLISNKPNSSFKIVCYYTFPSTNSSDTLQPFALDPHLCTHINIGFATVTNNSISITMAQSDIIRAIVRLKLANPDLKILLSIGGAGGTSGFPEMVVNHTTRKTFIRSIDTLIRNYSIDGIDLDWEFPNKVPSYDTKQKMHFTQLLYEIRQEINRQHQYKFLLTVAVAAPRFIIDLAYDINYMNSYVDFVNVMTYDYHFYTEFTPFTGINAPLYAGVNQTSYLASLNINYTINYWIENGMDKDKIVVGLPTYGHSFELYNVHNNGLMAPARGYGHLGQFGFVSYPDICAFLTENRVKLEFDYSARSPYASKDTEWISFDDETSLIFKAEYIKYYKYGGAMILSLNADDYGGRCKAVKFPLTNRVKTVLNDI